MDLAGPFGPQRRRVMAVVFAMLMLMPLAACADGADPQAATDAVVGAESAEGITSDRAATETSAMPESSVLSSETDETLPPFAELPRSAAPKGTAIALLTDVHAGRHGEFDRIVFEFAGSERPGYQVEWVEGPVATKGPGTSVDVAGVNRLRIAFDPASGVDLETGEVTYPGENRIEPPNDQVNVHEVVRTGDFKAVMTWVAGTDAVTPFRVVRLSQPTRVVVDVAVPPAR